MAEEKIDAIIHNIGYPDFITKEEELQLEVEGVRTCVAHNFFSRGELYLCKYYCGKQSRK